MASSADSNVKRHARIVYNSNFANINLFDILYIQKLKSLCRNVKKNVLFSDIVKSSVKLNCINASGQTSTSPGCGTSTRSVNRSHQTVNKEQGRNSYQSGNESCNTIHQRINVNPVVNQDVCNMVGHTDTNKKSNIIQYQSRFAHVNRFSPLEVDDSLLVDKNSSVSRLHDVKTQVVEIRARVQSTGHTEGKKTSLTCGSVDGGLVKDYGASTLGSNSSNSKRKNSPTTSAVLTEVPPLPMYSYDSYAQNSAIEGIMDEKYCLETNITQKSEKMNLAKKASKNKLFLEQNKPLFGFIPIYGLPSRVYDSNKGSICTDILQLHRQLRNDGRHNFKGLQIGVPSKLNAEAWAQYLGRYWDWQLPLLIKYGFPLDFDRNSDLKCENISHKSALEYPEHVSNYLKEEVQNNAMLGPFTEPPIDNLHTSPFMTRDKSSSVNRRVIIDLSWPIGNSVNSGVASDRYLDTEFVLTYPSIDNITDQVLQLGKSCKIFNVDISRAFRHVPIDPGDLDLLGLHWGNYFLDCSVPFGFKHGSSIFQRLSDSIRFIMAQEGHKIWNYIDDFLCISLPSQIHHIYDRLQQLLEELGLTVSSKKLVPPSTQVTCLGIVVNTVDFSIAIPVEKLAVIKNMCRDWSCKSTCSKKELQSLLGSLLYVAKCIKYARFFLNRMLNLLRQNFDNKHITLTREFHQDLQWFNRFLPVYNGVSFFNYTPSKVIHLDACPTGLGAIFDSQVYALPLPAAWHTENIAYLEMINILVALKVWHAQWAGLRVLIKCDNQAVVAVLNSGKARDLTLAKYARNIFFVVECV